MKRAYSAVRTESLKKCREPYVSKGLKEDEGGRFLQTVGNQLPQYTALLLNSSRPYLNNPA